MPQYVEYGPDQYMDPCGSSLMGYVTASYGDLVGLFGEPNCPAGDKTWNSWDISFTVFEDDEGEDHQDIYASIYDWKEMGPEVSRDGEKYRWHIGGFREKEHQAHWLVSDLVGEMDVAECPYTFERR